MLNRLTGNFLGGLMFLLLIATAVKADSSAAPRTTAGLKSGVPVRIVCFGDSVTGVYYHTGSRRAYTDMLGLALGKLYPQSNVTMFNAGLSGHTTVNGLARIEKDVIAHRPTLVTVMFGLNDMVRVPLDEYRANLKTIVAKCRENGAEVLLCTPNNVITTSGRPTEKLIQYCDVVRTVGRELKVSVCDCYEQLDALRQRDALAWRLLMSDAIHPNMDGHKRIAELIAASITGQSVSLAEVLPPSPVFLRTLSKVKQKKVIKVFAMAPVDKLISPALAKLGDDVQVEVTTWDVADKTLAEIEAEAQARVRAMKPDLVVIAVPRGAQADSQEALIHSFAWIMNWSLNFGPGGWDCLVVDPAVLDPASPESRRDALVRQLVRAQDLHLIERGADDAGSPQQILTDWIGQQR